LSKSITNIQFEEYRILDAIPCSVKERERCNVAEKMAVSISRTEERDVRERRAHTHTYKNKKTEAERPILQANQCE
jgi:hypothetical protein